MNFNYLLKKLSSGKTFEDICNEIGAEMVECIGNAVYEDEDLYEFLESIGSEIVDYEPDYITIESKDGQAYKVPRFERTNRFDDEYPDETILLFDIRQIMILKGEKQNELL